MLTLHYECYLDLYRKGLSIKSTAPNFLIKVSDGNINSSHFRRITASALSTSFGVTNDSSLVIMG
jgi:hypothetical protein